MRSVCREIAKASQSSTLFYIRWTAVHIQISSAMINSEGRAHEHPKRGLEQWSMDSSHLTGQVKRIGILKCSLAGTTCLYGFHCRHLHSSERHPSSRLPWSTEWSSWCISTSVAQFVQGRPDRPITLHPESLDGIITCKSCSQDSRQSHISSG